MTYTENLIKTIKHLHSIKHPLRHEIPLFYRHILLCKRSKTNTLIISKSENQSEHQWKNVCIKSKTRTIGNWNDAVKKLTKFGEICFKTLIKWGKVTVKMTKLRVNLTKPVQLFNNNVKYLNITAIFDVLVLIMLFKIKKYLYYSTF